MATPFEVRCERRTETGTNGNEETADPKPCPMSETRTRTFPLLLVGLLGGMRPAVRMKRNNISIFYILYIRLNWWPWLSLVIGLYKR